MKTPACTSPSLKDSVDFNVEELAMLCKALGHPVRVQLLVHLNNHGTCFFGKFTDVVPLAASTVSQHVTVLKEAGLIIGSPDEQRMCYCINPKRLELLKQLINKL
ncbi:ArsR/SmtB family transcription factor [Noviherbaspirillum sp.]|uniref:ArsR/SmtB family transcription factor n=1 Tax=Noviherbaspirillum sp. TaxID=1926288 RepID=UPI002FE20F7C